MTAAHKIVHVVCGDKASPTMTFHVTHGYTFKDLLIDSCEYWGVPRAEFYLRHPETGHVWQLHLVRAGTAGMRSWPALSGAER